MASLACNAEFHGMTPGLRADGCHPINATGAGGALGNDALVRLSRTLIKPAAGGAFSLSIRALLLGGSSLAPWRLPLLPALFNTMAA